jgi:hypothetical protein
MSLPTMSTPMNFLASKLSLAAALCLAASAPAFAQSADFSVWTRAGDAVVGLNLPSVTAVLSTAAVDSGEAPVGGGSGALQYYELEPALLLAGGFLAADTYEGSGLQQSFTLAAGSTATYSFAWTLSTQNYSAGFLDRAFVVIDGNTLAPLGTVAASTVAGNYSYTFTTPGAHAFAVAVLDVNDYTGVSVLGLSNLNVAVTAVPEPTSLGLMFGGLLAVGATVRARARRLQGAV